VGRGSDGGSHGPLDAVRHLAEHSVKDTIDAVTHSGSLVAQAGRTVIATMNPLALPHHLESALDLVRHPTKLIDVLTGFTSDDNETSNSWREVGRLLLHEKADAGAWSGHPDVDKGVAWTEGISLSSVKAVAQAFNGTVNDALMAAVSLALTDYLGERGVTDITDVAWMMPVSLQPVDGSLPSTLGNHFAVVLFEMPLGIADPAELIEQIHHPHDTPEEQRRAGPCLRCAKGDRRDSGCRGQTPHRLLLQQDDRAVEQRPRAEFAAHHGRRPGPHRAGLGPDVWRPAHRCLPVHLQRDRRGRGVLGHPDDPRP
jgi:hypothetical protein